MVFTLSHVRARIVNAATRDFNGFAPRPDSGAGAGAEKVVYNRCAQSDPNLSQPLATL